MSQQLLQGQRFQAQAQRAGLRGEVKGAAASLRRAIAIDCCGLGLLAASAVVILL